MMRLPGRVTAAFAALLALLITLAATPSQAQNGRVQMSVTSAGFIFGVAGGQGTLVFRGKTYPIRIAGLSAGFTFGGARADLIGNAYNLRSPYDIEGTYTQGEFGIAIAGGGRAVQLRNSRGVLLALRGRQIGLQISLDLSGMQISMRR